MKSKLILVAMGTLSCMHAEDNQFKGHGSHDRPLTSSVLKIIDGFSMAIDGKRVGFMLHVRKEIRKMHYGIPLNNGELQGIYSYAGKPVSIHQMMNIQDSAIQSGDVEELKSVDEALKVIKKDFIGKIHEFIGMARGSKGPLFTLIREFCERRKRPDSLLLRWGAAADGDEDRCFNRDITNFSIFDAFCADLVQFIEDLINSCPKAWAQFNQLVKEGVGKKS